MWSLITTTRDQYGLDRFFEIGPGKGALTTYLIELFPQGMLCEVDTSLEKHLTRLLSSHTDIDLVWKDILQVDPEDLIEKPAEILIVGNLPYYITSPILRQFFDGSKPFSCGIFLIQHEVAKKICHDATKKSYLRRLLNFQYIVSYEFVVDRESFSPPPKVQSAVIRLQPKEENDRPNVGYEQLLAFLEIVSPYKRKTLGKIAKMESEKRSAHTFSLPPELAGRRVEELWWEELEQIVGKKSLEQRAESKELRNKN